MHFHHKFQHSPGRKRRRHHGHNARRGPGQRRTQSKAGQNPPARGPQGFQHGSLIHPRLFARSRRADALARELPALESLTPTEMKVLKLVAEVKTTKEIADVLCISPRTVEIYRANVMSKMRAESLSDLIRSTIHAGAA